MPEEVLAQLGIAISALGTTTTISLRGECDLAQKPAMRAVINDVLERAPDCVVLDLSELSFIDSTGVHGVLELHKRSTQQHAHLVIVPGHRAVQRIFEITGLTEVLPFPHPDRHQSRKTPQHPTAPGELAALSPRHPRRRPPNDSAAGVANPPMSTRSVRNREPAALLDVGRAVAAARALTRIRR
jgi:anti-anti-sigma factor